MPHVHYNNSIINTDLLYTSDFAPIVNTNTAGTNDPIVIYNVFGFIIDNNIRNLNIGSITNDPISNRYFIRVNDQNEIVYPIPNNFPINNYTSNIVLADTILNIIQRKLNSLYSARTYEEYIAIMEDIYTTYIPQPIITDLYHKRYDDICKLIFETTVDKTEVIIEQIPDITSDELSNMMSDIKNGNKVIVPLKQPEESLFYSFTPNDIVNTTNSYIRYNENISGITNSNITPNVIDNSAVGYSSLYNDYINLNTGSSIVRSNILIHAGNNVGNIIDNNGSNLASNMASNIASDDF